MGERITNLAQVEEQGSWTGDLQECKDFVARVEQDCDKRLDMSTSWSPWLLPAGKTLSSSLSPVPSVDALHFAGHVIQDPARADSSARPIRS